VERKLKLQEILSKSKLPDVICGKYVERRGIDLFTEVCQRNLEGIVAKRKSGTYSTISGWLKIKNPNSTQSEQRHELFELVKGAWMRKRRIPLFATVLLHSKPAYTSDKNNGGHYRNPGFDCLHLISILSLLFLSNWMYANVPTPV
jgi:hypothetical protein